MELVRLHVANFRGIRTLEWVPSGRVQCLIGPGDSGKTTVLDAIEWALWPRPTLAVSDADFFGLTTAEPIVIEATVAGVPERLLTDGTFGLHQQSVEPTGEVTDEPTGTSTRSALTVRLTVDSSLEPQWTVVCGPRLEPRRVTYPQRQALGVTRLGGAPDRHLRWGRGSALERLTDAGGDVATALADTYRTVRKGLDGADLSSLDAVIDKVRAAVPAYGARISADDLEAGVDPAALNPSGSALALEVSGVPLSSWGLGTRSLVALAVQIASVPEGAIVLIDEIEAGLEPHRLRHVLCQLQETVGGAPDAAGAKPAQVILTTHSPTAVVELAAKTLCVARREPTGACVLGSPSPDVQGIVRSQPEAMLASSVILGEGATEYGLLRGLDLFWGAEAGGVPLANLGVGLANGESRTKAPGVAIGLARLGYRVALVVDSDEPIVPEPAAVEAEGVHLTQWDGRTCTEERLAADLPVAGLAGLVQLMEDEWGVGQVRGNIAALLKVATEDLPESVQEWIADHGESPVREAVGAAMKTGGWIKRIDRAEPVGRLLAGLLPDMAGSDLAEKLAALRAWTSGG